MLENLALEEGVLHVFTSNCVPALDLEPIQAIQKQVAQVPLNNSIEDDIVLADLPRQFSVSSQNNRGLSDRLGVHQ